MNAKVTPTPTDVSFEYERQLWQIRYTPDGRFLVAGAYDGTVRRWDLTGEAPREIEPLTGHDGWVQCIEVAATGDRLLSADSWGRLSCWRPTDERPQPIWSIADAHDGWIRGLSISPNGERVATGGQDGLARIRNVSDGELVAELEHPERVFSVRFHPDGESLVTGDRNGVVREWDLAGKKVVRTFDASMLYRKDRIQDCGGVRVLEFNEDGTRLACGGQKEPGGGFAKGTPCVLVFDWATAEVVREMPVGGTQDGFAYDVRFHPDGYVMGCSGAFPGKGHVWFWKPEDDAAFFVSEKLPNGRGLDLHPDGDRLAFMTSVSRNGNGRSLKDGEYPGGHALVRLLDLVASAE